MSLFRRLFGGSQKIEESLSRTRERVFGAVTTLLRRAPAVDEHFWEELEELLLQADMGVNLTLELLDTLRERARAERPADGSVIEAWLRELLLEYLDVGDPGVQMASPLTVVLVVGVNGVGKTTSIAKLARYFKDQGLDVMLAAGDTFRAAAIDQLKIWGERVGVPVIAHQPNSDPGAVVYDAIEAARARGADVLIIDTAGRLHTKVPLMDELRKIARVIGKAVPGAPHETLLVVDAISGQNALVQARTFQEAIGLTGVVLAKLDSSSKGGVVFQICQELQVPVKFVGTGEKASDLAPFDPQTFVDALFEQPQREPAPEPVR
ncbi:MAG: signal recognition particle-docking protein FtsY [Chloroflexota bacterium]